MKVAQALTDAEILTLTGKRQRLGALWDGQPLVVVWLRHYG
jgi:hypothetical protein